MLDRDEVLILEAATAQGLNLSRSADGKWSVGLSTATEPLTVEAKFVDTFLSDGMIRLADGRVFKREMTTQEVRAALGIDG